MPSLKFINSKTVNLKKYVSQNNTPIKAIGVFDFALESYYTTDFYIFTFHNQVEERTEYVIITSGELYNRFSASKQKHILDNQINLVLWLMPNNYLFDTTNIGTEGEWFFIGGGMAEGTEMDYSQFLNNWDLLK